MAISTPHLELAHHPIHDDKDYDQYIGDAALKSIGRKRWNKRVWPRADLRPKSDRLRRPVHRRRQCAKHQNDVGTERPHRFERRRDHRRGPALGSSARSRVRRGVPRMSHDDPDADARNALRLIGPDPANWVPDRAGIDHNVTIVGGGQTGCALAFALRRAGIGKVTVLEAAPDEQRAGIWLNAARMNLLRTPKALPGPELGIPAFSFQAWYEARHGQEAYAAIDRIDRLDWALYLSWYKRFLNISPRYGTSLTRIEPVGDHFRCICARRTAPRRRQPGKIILATGFSGAAANSFRMC
jgi:hypothetical protein